MPGREFIHTQEDESGILRYAQTLGLKVMPDTAPRDKMIDLGPSEIASAGRGVFHLFLPKWVAYPLKIERIEAGGNAGKYYLKGVNFAEISIYFQGEGEQDGRRRLGSGDISFKREWLDDQAHEMRPSPPEISQYYNALCKELLSRQAIKAGVHRYFLCRHAAEVAASADTLPPFDFIPWPPPSYLDGENSRHDCD